MLLINIWPTYNQIDLRPASQNGSRPLSQRPSVAKYLLLMAAQIKAWVLLENLNKILIYVNAMRTSCLQTLRIFISILNVVP
jgi:hypothetical protein